MNKEYQVEFYFGVRPVSSFSLYVAAIFLSLAVTLISHYTKSEKKDLWAIIDKIGLHYNISVINKLIISVPELLENRIDREIDDAIEDYNSQVELDNPKPIFSEVVEGETPLGGEMRIQSPWTKDNIE